MSKLTPMAVKWPMERIDISRTKKYYELHAGDPVLTAHIDKTAVKVIDMQECQVYDAAIRAAYEGGIDILYIMDKQFVLDALREKLERDYYGRRSD